MHESLWLADFLVFSSHCFAPVVFILSDGLSGSVSSASGEVGILGGTFGQGTVAKGEDKPPSVNLPGLDFSSASGRKLIGY